MGIRWGYNKLRDSEHNYQQISNINYILFSNKRKAGCGEFMKRQKIKTSNNLPIK